MPIRTKADHEAIVETFARTGSGRETARQLGLHENTVYQVLKKHRGTCRRCAKPLVGGHSYCTDCLEHLRVDARAERAELKRLGLCVRCRQPRTTASRLYCDEHRLAAIATNQRYEARKRSAHGGLPSSRDRLHAIRTKYGEEAVELWIAQGSRCQICGVAHKERAVHIHHIDLDDSNNSAANLALLCFRCHRLSHLLVEHPDPAAVLAWLRTAYPKLNLV